MGLHLDVGVGDTVTIGGVTLVLEQKSGVRARLNITAPREVPIELKSASGAKKVFPGGRGKSAHECLTQHQKPLREDTTHGEDRNRRE